MKKSPEQERIDEIEARLPRSSWDVKVTSNGHSPAHYSVCHKGDQDPVPLAGNWLAHDNVEFVAHAPDDMRWLLGRLKGYHEAFEAALACIQAVSAGKDAPETIVVTSLRKMLERPEQDEG